MTFTFEPGFAALRDKPHNFQKGGTVSNLEGESVATLALWVDSKKKWIALLYIPKAWVK